MTDFYSSLQLVQLKRNTLINPSRANYIFTVTWKGTFSVA